MRLRGFPWRRKSFAGVGIRNVAVNLTKDGNDLDDVAGDDEMNFVAMMRLVDRADGETAMEGVVVECVDHAVTVVETEGGVACAYCAELHQTACLAGGEYQRNGDDEHP